MKKFSHQDSMLNTLNQAQARLDEIFFCMDHGELNDIQAIKTNKQLKQILTQIESLKEDIISELELGK